jgi:tRNA dimethylallyltransferase
MAALDVRFDLEPILRHAIYLTGPTASGKSAVGVALAHRLGAEVIALDSMTLYRGMDIGTAKPTPVERQGIPHHLIDVLDPWEHGSVADYRVWALAAAGDITTRGRRVLFVGGTPLYLKALIRGLFSGPAADPTLRAELEADAERLGDAGLHARLAEIDPRSAARLHPNDRRRIVRALEVFRLTGVPLSRWQTEHEHPAQGLAVFALARDRPDLHRRINTRVEGMFAAGFREEVEQLANLVPPLHSVPAQAVGYKEGLACLAGTLDVAEAMAQIQARTRQFAKRQETWFRNLAEVQPWPVGREEPAEATAERLAERLDLGRPTGVPDSV